MLNTCQVFALMGPYSNFAFGRLALSGLLYKVLWHIRTMIKNEHIGFTLIEFATTVAVVGVLVVISLFIQSGYVTRAQISEAISLANGVETYLTVYAAERSAWPAGLTDLGVPLIGSYASVTDISGDWPVGTITVTMTTGIASSGTLLFKTTDGSIWTCSSITINSRYLPSSCK